MKKDKNISGELVVKFADISVLRYEVIGFDNLDLNSKLFVYHLSQAALWGRDIIFDQNFKYNLKIKKLFESIYKNYNGDRNVEDFVFFQEYLFRFWFSSGIHHHYSGDKFLPKFSKDFILKETHHLWSVGECLSIDNVDLNTILEAIFSKDKYLKKTNQSGDDDLILSSSVNMYSDDITENDVEKFYTNKKNLLNETEREKSISFGLNSYKIKDENGDIHELTYSKNALYGEAINKICEELSNALAYAHTEKQRDSILLLLEYYNSGDLKKFDEYSCCWVKDNNLNVDFINGFIETYSDPISMCATWESIVYIKDTHASKRSNIICSNAKWFEDNSPIDDEFKKENPIGISASVVNAAILSGDSFPSTPIGVNLPNADWIRKEFGSKSISIENIHYAYDEVSKDSGLLHAFIDDEDAILMIKKYGHITDRLHTDMHECLGHGSGKLAKGVDSDSLGAYSSVIEETRADLFALYFMADKKMIDLGLLPDEQAYKACYYSYILNGKITQLTRIEPGNNIEEAHMRNRYLIANWILDNASSDTIEINGINIKIHNYEKLRYYFGLLLKEIQRIKSTGDKDKAKELIEKYGIYVEKDIHQKVLDIYCKLNISPYKGFVNPKYELVVEDYDIKDVRVSYKEGYAEQMIRYSQEYSTLPLEPLAIECLKNPLPISISSEKIAKNIRENLRRSMDGVVAKSMRDKGLHYSINFGLTRQYILNIAKKVEKNYNLASYLFSRDVRELKLIGQMIFPIELMTYTKAKYLAISTSYNPELRDWLVIDLLDKCPNAPFWALDFITENNPYPELITISFSVLNRFFKRGLNFETEVLKDKLYSFLLYIFEDHNTQYQASVLEYAMNLMSTWANMDSTIKERFISDTNRLKWKDDEIKREFLDYVMFNLDDC